MPPVQTAHSTPLRASAAILAAAGLAVLATPARAQSVIEWASPVDGDFGVAGNWFPSAVPGELDTAVLGGVGPYVVSTDRQTVAAVDFANPQAILAIVPDEFLVVSGAIGPGTILVNRDQSRDNAGLGVTTGAQIGARIVLNAPPDTSWFNDAQLYGPVSLDDGWRLTEEGVITGRGTIYRRLHNDGVIETVGPDGFLAFERGRLTQGPGGVVRSIDGGAIGLFESSFITGGTLDGGTDGRISGWRSRLEDVTIEGTWGVEVASDPELIGRIDGDGTIVINPTQSTAADARVLLDPGVQVGVKVRLNASPDALPPRHASFYGGATMAEAARLTEQGVVSGRGTLAYELINDGLIESPGPDGYLHMTNSRILQGPGGVVRSVDGGTIAGFFGSVIVGGTVDGGTEGRLAGTGFRFDGVALEGTWGLEAGTVLFVMNRTEGDGTIVVNRSQDPVQTPLYWREYAEVGFKVVLNAPPASTDLTHAYVGWTPSGLPPILLPEGSISGHGMIGSTLTVGGTLAPGFEDGDVSLLELSGVDLTFTPTARVAIDVGGAEPTEHDRLAGTGDLVLDGTLEVGFVGGYAPEPTDRFEVIRATTIEGAFATTDIDPVGPTGPAHLLYTGESVVVVVCAADRDGDGELTIFDFLEFLNQFDLGNPQADLDRDGELTILDFLAFQNRFDAGC